MTRDSTPVQPHQWCRAARPLVSLVLFGLGAAPAFAQFESVQVKVIDVGQADAILIRTPNRLWVLVDGGPGSLLADSLPTQFGVDHLAMVVASHRHFDHIGGLPNLVSQIPVDLFIGDTTAYRGATFARLRSALRERNILVELPRADTIVIDSVQFIVLPRPPPHANENNNSVALRVQYGKFSMLLPGDAEAAQRDWLIANTPALLDVTVLKASLHGSRNGTSDTWLNAVTPSYVVISAGVNSLYGQPHAEAVDAYEAATSGRVHCTNRNGSVSVFGFPDGRVVVQPQVQSSRSCAFQQIVVAREAIAGTADVQTPIQIARAGRLDTVGTDVESFVIRPEDVVSVPAHPGAILVPDARAEGVLVWPDVDTVGVQLRFDAGREIFAATLRVGLRDLDTTRLSGNLLELVRLQVTADPGSTMPSDLAIGHTGLPYDSVRVTSRTMQNSLRLIVRTNAHFPPIEYTLGIERESLALRPTSLTILGFGLEEVDVTLNLPPVFVGKPRSASIEATLGRVSAPLVTIDSGGTAVVSIRSRRLGVDTVTATVLGITSGTTTITFAFPLWFMIAALAGATIGGLVPDRRPGSRWRRPAWKTVSGLASGLLLVVIFAVGLVDFPTGVSEASVFAVAGLGGVFGLRALEGVRRLLPSLGGGPG